MRDAGQKEYARTEDDVHANFKRVGEYLNISPEKAILVYLLKHVDGITAYVDGHRSQREAIEGRVIDAVVYLFLLWGLLDEKKPICVDTPYPANKDEWENPYTDYTPVPEFEKTE